MALAPSDIVNCTLASGLLIGINNKIKFWVAPEVNYSKKNSCLKIDAPLSNWASLHIYIKNNNKVNVALIIKKYVCYYISKKSNNMRIRAI